MPFITQGKTNIKYILIIVILAVIAGGGILAYQYWWLPKQETQPSEIKLPEKVKDETANWKTYRNKEYGFEVKYPKEWNIGVGDAMSDVIHWAAPDKGYKVPWIMDITVSKRNGKTVDEWVWREDFPYEVVKAIEVEGSKGIMVRDPVTIGNDYHIAFFPVEDYMYSVGIASSPPEISTGPIDLLTQILSTFSFIEPEEEVNLEDIINKELLDENDLYAVYLINPRITPPTKTGEIIVFDKIKKEAAKMEGEFSIFGSAIIYNNEKNEYILLSTGTYILRGVITLSLITKKQAIEEFCINLEPYFWQDFVIYRNCDTYERPWGGGEAPSIAIMNLKTGEGKTIFKSGPTKEYGIEKIEGTNLVIEERSVDKVEDWFSEELNKLQKTDIITYDLKILEFCGWSTNGSCSSDPDCMDGGCSGQVCQSKNEEEVITTCEYTDCYSAEKYGLDCKCTNNKCQWSK